MTTATPPEMKPIQSILTNPVASDAHPQGPLAPDTIEQQLWPPLLQMGDALAVMGKYDKAATIYQAAVHISQRHPDTLIALAAAASNLGPEHRAFCREAYETAGEIMLRQNEVADESVQQRIERFMAADQPSDDSMVRLSKFNAFRAAAVCTVPRSGSFYCRYFLHYYHQLLKGTPADQIQHEPLPNGIDVSDTISQQALYIHHAICPGFRRHQPENRAAWDALTPIIYRPMARAMWIVAVLRQPKQMLEMLLDPAYNPKSRIVFVYRNPLDQIVSACRHMQNFHDPSVKLYYGDEQKPPVSIDSPQTLLRTQGLSQYLKMFMSFYWMHQAYPKQVLMVSYEQLTGHPRQRFAQILCHLGSDPLAPQRRAAFDQALAMSDMASLKKVEASKGQSLGGDQKVTGETHMRDGSIGKWKEHFTDDDLAWTNRQMEPFGISLSDFELSPPPPSPPKIEPSWHPLPNRLLKNFIKKTISS